MNLYALPALLILPPLLLSCKTTNVQEVNTTTYWVNSSRIPCTGVAPMHCLQIRKEGSGTWQLLYSDIEGFEYEPGYLYRIRVRAEQLDPQEVPADASAIRYRLVAVKEKVPDRRLRLHDIWVLTTLEGRVVRPPDHGQSMQPYIEFHIRDNRYMGFDGCNTFTGSIDAVEQNNIRLGPALGTKIRCADMTVADAFLRLLSRSDTYRISGLTLTLLEGDAELLKFQKTD